MGADVYQWRPCQQGLEVWRPTQKSCPRYKS